MHRVYLALGSNLNHPMMQLCQAIAALMALPHSEWVGSSSFYHSKPMGPQNQPDYINAVVAIDTQLTAKQLLAETQAVERLQGRVRTRRWGERVIDIDILLYGNEIHTEGQLQIPHPHMGERFFVMLPLLEVMAAEAGEG